MNPFQSISSPGLEFTPRPSIKSHEQASAFLDTRYRELAAGIGMLAHAGELALAAGDLAEARKLLDEAAPLREQLASIEALVEPCVYGCTDHGIHDHLCTCQHCAGRRQQAMARHEERTRGRDLEASLNG